MKLALASLCIGLCLSLQLGAQSTPQTTLLALSKRAHTLAIVDPSSLQVIARVPVGNDPHEVIASSDGSTAYVSNYGFGAYNTLAVIDLVHQQAMPSIDLGPLRGPHGLTFVDGKVWFTAEAAKAIGRYDPAGSKVDWILGTGQNRTHMIFVSQDVQSIITTNVSSATVSLIEKIKGQAPGGPPPPMPAGSGPPPGPPPMGAPGGDWNETVIPVGKGSEGFDVSPSGSEIWVANAQDGTVSIIDRASKTVTQTLAANMQGANRLKFTPDGKLVFISSLRQPDLAIYDAATRKEVKRIKIGHGAAGIVMQPDGARVYVACSPDNYVAVIDLKTLEVTGHIDVGAEPDGLAWAIRH
ncbi:YncE family protein [Alloacidobacterium dinghuense]|uniref:YncE family protein n=2 Tax=Alloacidobacterium dinghuense TaxID=2763107 RepID=A0A7G8BR60_9BACT|nr:YncE family protein [Alloacidobacterium dinghuense]